jgi:hypothetical protein
MSEIIVDHADTSNFLADLSFKQKSPRLSRKMSTLILADDDISDIPSLAKGPSFRDDEFFN